MKRHIVERTNKAERRPEEQSEKTESCQENLLIEIQLNGPKRQQQKTRRKNRLERIGQARLVYVIDMNRNIPTT